MQSYKVQSGLFSNLYCLWMAINLPKLIISDSPLNILTENTTLQSIENGDLEKLEDSQSGYEELLAILKVISTSTTELTTSTTTITRSSTTATTMTTTTMTTTTTTTTTASTSTSIVDHW